MSDTQSLPASGAMAKGWLGPILVALIGAFMSILDSSIVNVAVPTIMNVFNASTSEAQWVSTAYMLAMGVVVPLSGWLGDKIGLKRMYLLSMIAFVVGSMACTLSWSIESLIVARVIQAIGGGMIMPATMSMIYKMVPKDKIGGAMGIFGIALLVAPAIGPTLGGYLVEYVDWRWIFTINLPIGVVGVLLSLAVLPEFPPGKAGRFDIGGFITSAGGLFCLLLALSNGADWGWGSEETIILFFLSATLLGLFVYIELTSDAPLLDLRVFKYRSFTLANLVTIVATIGLFAGLFYLPLFLQSVRGLGAMETGLLMMPGALVSGIMMPLAGRLYDRVGPRVLIVAGMLLLAVITFTFHYLSLDIAYSTITLWVLVRGGVLALANLPAQTASMVDIPPELISRASAMTNIIRNVASSLGLAVLTALLGNRVANHAAHMSDNLTAWNPALGDFVQSFSTQTGAGQASALQYLGGQISKQAFVLGIDDVFIVAAALTVAGVLPALFLKKGKGGASAAPMAE